MSGSVEQASGGLSQSEMVAQVERVRSRGRERHGWGIEQVNRAARFVNLKVTWEYVSAGSMYSIL